MGADRNGFGDAFLPGVSEEVAGGPEQRQCALRRCGRIAGEYLGQASVEGHDIPRFKEHGSVAAVGHQPGGTTQDGVDLESARGRESPNGSAASRYPNTYTPTAD